MNSPYRFEVILIALYENIQLIFGVSEFNSVQFSLLITSNFTDELKLAKLAAYQNQKNIFLFRRFANLRNNLLITL